MKTVLIVDDTKTNIDVLVQILKADYKIGVSLNGKDAIQFAKKTPPGSDPSGYCHAADGWV